jgi:hypothetical protein
MRLRIVAGGAFLSVLLSGCGGTGVAAPGAAYRLYVLAHGQVGQFRLMDGATGRLDKRLPLGTPAPDWSRLYTVAHRSGQTLLSAVDPLTGATRHQIAVDGSFDLPAANDRGMPGGLSPDGQWLVLQSRTSGGHTSFMRANTAFTGGPTRIILDGSLVFDAISNDGNLLYLIESLTAPQPGRYRVRLYDIGKGSFDPRIVIDKREAETGAMTGIRLSGLFAPNGRWLYSLYLNEQEGAFIHALSLDGNLAWCIDLPAQGGTPAEQRMWSLAARTDGAAVYAVNPVLGKVAVVEIGPDGPSGEVSRVGTFTAPVRKSSGAGLLIDALAKEAMFGSATLSGDEHTLFATGGNGISAIDLVSLTNTRQLLSNTALDSVVLTKDGRWLFVSSWEGPSILQVDPTTGRAVKRQSTSSPVTLYRAELR